MSRLIFLTGVPGVGKTTLASEVAERRPLTYLSAGSLIARALQARERDELKNGAILDNQSLLIEGFRDAVSGVDGVIVLDGHLMVRGEEGLVTIPRYVFRELGCDHLVVLTNDPDKVATNRSNDLSRRRLPQSVEDLLEDQTRIISRAHELAAGLRCHVTEVSLRNYGDAVGRLESIVATEQARHEVNS